MQSDCERTERPDLAKPSTATSSIRPLYHGRFAPSPTGPLHFGSLVTAAASYLQARSCSGHWSVRIDDLDMARAVANADRGILETLQRYGFCWDGPVIYQSQHAESYRGALEFLGDSGFTYPCGCSRREIADSTIGAPAHWIYPGTCRRGLARGRTGRSIRLRVGSATVEAHDRIQGTIRQQLAHSVGDFVLYRTDGQHAYQLAVVVDDARQGVTEVVRGSDLLDSTPRQIYLQQLLRLPLPDYMHIPTAVDGYGNKLSKQTHAPALDSRNPVPTLARALAFLGQPLPKHLQNATLNALWEWAVGHWDTRRIPRCRTQLADAP